MKKRTHDFEVEVNGDKFTIKRVFRTEYAALHDFWRNNTLLYIFEPGLSALRIPGWNLLTNTMASLWIKD
ncbi:MAG: hypothetical protein M3015_13230 [Bacteroidota bacterium]|nr:hypothetical protein [Bacteroidota bacterium]